MYDLVSHKDPILREKLEDLDFVNTDVDPIEFAKILAEKMVEYGGVGLAANQIGKRIRAFALASNPVIVMYNPQILDYSTEVITLEEGCLTYPGLIVKVTRPKSIKIRFTLPNGETQTQKYTGITARIIQHEIEHLDGQLFFDNVDWYEKEKYKRWVKHQKRKTRA